MVRGRPAGGGDEVRPVIGQIFGTFTLTWGGGGGAYKLVGAGGAIAARHAVDLTALPASLHRSLAMPGRFCPSAGFIAAALAAMGVIVSEPSAQAGMAGQVVVEHVPTGSFGSPSDTEFIPTTGAPIPQWQLFADDFTLTSSATIGRIEFWGFYSLDNPLAVETHRIRIFEARPNDGLPGVLLTEQILQNVPRVATGSRIPTGISPREFLYDAMLHTAFSAMAGAKYWLEIVQIGDLETAFRWEHGRGPASRHAFMNVNVSDWTLTSSTIDLAFRLSTSVPEPSFLVLLSALFGLGDPRMYPHRWKRTQRNK